MTCANCGNEIKRSEGSMTAVGLTFHFPECPVPVWIVDGMPRKPVAHRVIECGRRVHAAGLSEDLHVRVLGDWRGWWESLQRRAEGGKDTG